jgi:hypothetical protein
VATHWESIRSLRYTKDIDIWINNSLDNAERMFQALKAFGAPLGDVTVDDFSASDLVYQIGVEPSRIDILMGLEAMDFEDCWKRRVTAELDELTLNFISIADLIENKERTGRPQASLMPGIYGRRPGMIASVETQTLFPP